MQLHQMFIQNAKKFGKRMAIIDKSLNRSLTYSRALIAALLLTKKFEQLKGNFIGVMMPNSAGCVLSILGTLMAGKIPVMINYSVGAEKNAKYAQKKCSFSPIVTSKKLLEKVGCPKVDGMIFIEDIMESITKIDKIKAALFAKLPKKILLSKIHQGDSDDDALILFTSGSEKSPKAVELTHRSIMSNVIGSNERLDIREEDRFLSILPFFHVFGQTTSLWLPLYRGTCMITYANPLEYKTVVEIIREETPTLLVATPVFYMGYLRQANSGDFKTIRLSIVGADKAPDWLREKFLKDHNITLFEGYGTTETSPVISVNAPGANRPGSVGQPLLGVEVKIVDINTGESLPPGEEGKILVKGDLVMKGYYADIEETSLRVVNGWYETGDMGVLDEDNYLWHRGRLKRFVKIGGEMVSLVMVEYHLEKVLEDNKECCVVEIPDPRKGAKIIAVITAQTDDKALLNRLSEHVPPIALPKKVLVIEELPKMPSGKVDFRSTTELVIKQLEE